MHGLAGNRVHRIGKCAFGSGYAEWGDVGDAYHFVEIIAAHLLFADVKRRFDDISAIGQWVEVKRDGVVVERLLLVGA